MTDGSVVAVVAVSIVASAAATFFGPAIWGYLPRVVGDEAQLGPANSAWATLDSLAFIIGPGVAGVLIALGGLPAAFLLNAASFAVCALVLLGPPHGRPEPAPAADTGAERGASIPAGGWRRVAGGASWLRHPGPSCSMRPRPSRVVGCPC